MQQAKARKSSGKAARQKKQTAEILIQGLDSLAVMAEDVGMGCAARILYQAKEEMVHWAVTMNFHESAEDRFVNRCLYGGHRPAIEALLLRTLKNAGAKGDMMGVLGLPARK